MEKTFRSASRPGVVYTARITEDGKLTCTCMGWTIRRQGRVRHCKHTAALAGKRQVKERGEFQFVAAKHGREA